ncbi:NACHT domain-containing protein [Capilliphycus salinus ALCB114379]|uniref:NACHT domain-containing protein n=1 Tax=Capilliphycus salinus TaxID=2768948 RepID=UPI0039A47862
MLRFNSNRLPYQKRYQLLQHVKNEVKQYRLQSPHRAVLTHLVRETPPLRMRRIWDIEAKVGNRPSFRLSSDCGIIPIFDRIGGKLLILGGTGAGKTTTLMGLAKVLVRRALNDEGEPIPLLLNLATWTDSEQSIESWIVEQLKIKYDVPTELAKDWIEHLQVLPLLDGLDEVLKPQQNGCILKLNEFLSSNICPLHIVVCSNVEAYHNCEAVLRLNGAILLRPLTKKQIRTYLMNARSRELWNNIENDESLLKLAKKPLFLSLMTLAYEEILISSWKRLQTLEEQRQYLFNAYIRTQIAPHREQPTSRKNWEEKNLEKVRHGLEWLAKRLEEENKSEFSIQEISPSWLQDYEQEKKYSIGVKFVSGLIWWGIVALIALGVIFESIWVVLFGLIVGLIWAFLYKRLAINNWIEQSILRGFLSYKGYLPWQTKQFLNTATKRLLLQKVGRRYRFIHRLLQQHFSQM